MDLAARLDFAHGLADAAGALAVSFFEQRESLAVEQKGLQDLVSRADRDVESLIRERIARAFPEDTILGEEHGGTPGESVWCIDPIDGTTNFLRGLPHWAVSIGFVHRNVPELGLIWGPTLGERFVAARGKGATLNGKPIHVSKVAALDQAVVAFGSSRKTGQAGYLSALGALMSAGIEYRRLGSAAHNLCQVACGRLEGYFEAKLSPWDAAAGLLLVTEAGGRTNDYFANDGMTQGNAVLASNAALYGALSQATGVP
jgi:myo-inositol-1(or 4)-monophosphatase